jgi:hypothetical protein
MATHGPPRPRSAERTCASAVGARITTLTETRLPARLQRRGRPPALNAGKLGAAAAARHGARACRSKLRGSRIRPCLPTHSLLGARAIAAAATQPASHALRQLRLPPSLPPPSAARPCRLCSLRQVCPEPISLAASRPHGHRAAAARGSMCAQERRTRCLQGLSPRRARRAGRMLAPLCAQHRRGARPPRRWR